MARGGGIKWLGWLVAGLLAVAGGVWVAVAQLSADQLSTADQVAGVVAAVVAVLGVPIAVYGVVVARRGAGSAGPAPGGEVRQRVRSGGTAVVAAGDLRVGRRRSLRGSDPAARGPVHQDVQAGQDANVAGRDLHVEQGPDPR
ncbi:hypothetical protein QLQ12_39070 [Actinoplanes sp. NEAU-A12]|uniref:Uncharacterized protein n=1 Tax=Actinoplanes sandaracinus TaxID=3045177 RepID=A0ABT6WXY8_9ACTN|nr:hypothetical protein [Actinoplanes sandaracinus]MDI6104610.1 hypothetical protein [Actinoplanes sandaracinus]